MKYFTMLLMLMASPAYAQYYNSQQPNQPYDTQAMQQQQERIYQQQQLQAQQQQLEYQRQQVEIERQQQSRFRTYGQ